MNIIEKVREILQNFPKIQEVCNAVHVDFTDPEPTSYGLSSVGDRLVKSYILGNQIRQHNFFIYSTFSSINDYERLENSSVLLELAQWLEKQVDGEIIQISAENGQLFAVPQENESDGWQYQLQIVVHYKT
ncbi:MAG: hypothetical protein NC040_10515 [Muribaculaceae bacterium]|nr:hypothetical protein [Alistipes senegalensis]MCM1474484.1 hypothetical protein [Muribaculaceae bacterium]